MAITLNTGISQYLKYGTSSANTYAGRVTGGELRKESGLIWRPSTGGKHGAGSGITSLGGTATIEIADATLINYFTRTSYTSPSLTPLVFEGALVGQNNYGWTQSGCVINSLDVEVGVGDALTATIEWMATDEAEQAAPSPPTHSGTRWEWFHGECTLNGGTYKLQRMRLSASNNCEPLSSIEDKSANAWRRPEDFKVGKQTVTLSAEMIQRPSTTMWNLHEDTLVTGVSALVQCTNGVNTLTFQLANLGGVSGRMPFEGDDGTVIFALEFEGEPNASDTLAISYS